MTKDNSKDNYKQIIKKLEGIREEDEDLFDQVMAMYSMAMNMNEFANAPRGMSPNPMGGYIPGMAMPQSTYMNPPSLERARGNYQMSGLEGALNQYQGLEIAIEAKDGTTYKISFGNDPRNMLDANESIAYKSTDAKKNSGNKGYSPKSGNSYGLIGPKGGTPYQLSSNSNSKGSYSRKGSGSYGKGSSK